MRIPFLLGTSLALAAASVVTAVTVAPRVDPEGSVAVAAGANEFVETFDSAAALDRFEFAVHHPVLFFQPIRSWQGDHDAGCGAPPSTRTVNLPGNRNPGDGKTYDRVVGEAVYWCAPGGAGTGHMMTSFNTDSYAQIDFSPKQVFTDVKHVCWDQNMTDLGPRKWTQLVVVPEATFQANGGRMDYVAPRIETGPGADGLRVRGDTFLLEVLQGSTAVSSGGGDSTDFKGFTTADKKRRFKTCVTDLGNGQVRIELERESSVETRVMRGSFPTGPVRVIFQDDTYNAPKAPPKLNVPDPFTWHWDNIIVNTAAVPAPTTVPVTTVPVTTVPETTVPPTTVPVTTVPPTTVPVTTVPVTTVPVTTVQETATTGLTTEQPAVSDRPTVDHRRATVHRTLWRSCWAALVDRASGSTSVRVERAERCWRAFGQIVQATSRTGRD
jgi:hypothetical protein